MARSETRNDACVQPSKIIPSTSFKFERSVGARKEKATLRSQPKAWQELIVPWFRYCRVAHAR